MTKRDWLSVALKTSGVVLAILYLQVLFFGLGMYLSPSVWRGPSAWRSTVALLLSLGATAGGFVVGLLLAKEGDLVADHLLKTELTPIDDRGLRDQRGIFFASLKFIGVVAATQGLVRLPAFIGLVLNRPRLYEDAPALSVLIRQVAWPLVLLAVSAYLIFGGKRLMRLSYGREIEGQGSEEVGPWTPQRLFALALRVFGVVLVTRKLPWLIRSLVMEVFPLAVEARKSWFGAEPSFNWGNFLGGLLILAIAVYLISGAKHLVNFVFRKRTPEPA